MIYPDDFENRLGFDRIREQTAHFLSTSGARELLSEVGFSGNIEVVRTLLGQTLEMRTILISEPEFEVSEFRDVNKFLHNIRVEGTFLEPAQMVELWGALEMVASMTSFFEARRVDELYTYPLLWGLGEGLADFSPLVVEIKRIVDRFGAVRDSASAELGALRRSIVERESMISKRLHQILRKAQADGYADADSQIVIRDGRAVLPVMAGNKRKIKGLVHSESATGRTAYIEPLEVVELNNEVTELELQQRREVIRILMAFADLLRPRIADLLLAGDYLCGMELIVAKARLALGMDAVMPTLVPTCGFELRAARHPLLEQSLRLQGKTIVPLDIRLTEQKRILLISGPNAGGKSVCLKSVGLLQYMLQCGFLVPVASESVMGMFGSLFVDIGDQQNLDNDLSTYSSHLMNMRRVLECADERSLVLIDEFGSGTEPTTGGAIAESVLEVISERGVFGVITTHYANLKYFASSAERIENGAMMFDVQNIMPLFKLEMGHAGSSFAFEIARKTGLPEQIVTMAAAKIGVEQVDLERQLRQVARDKRYWQTKRESIRNAERGVDRAAAQYEMELSEIQRQRTEIIRKAKDEAQRLLAEANRKIENTIRQIKESAAQREATRAARAELEAFKEAVGSNNSAGYFDAFGSLDSLDSLGSLGSLSSDGSLPVVNEKGEVVLSDDPIVRKMQKLKAQQARREAARRAHDDNDSVTSSYANSADSALQTSNAKNTAKATKSTELQVGFKVRITGQDTIGEVLSISGNKVAVAFGALMTSVERSRLEVVPHAEFRRQKRAVSAYTKPVVGGYDTARQRLDFSQQLDVRGMRGADALDSVQMFVDQAIMLGFSQVSILHGKGTGALKQQIRDYLNAQPIVSEVRDEHEEFGGAGITLVTFDI